MSELLSRARAHIPEVGIHTQALGAGCEVSEESLLGVIIELEEHILALDEKLEACQPSSSLVSQLERRLSTFAREISPILIRHCVYVCNQAAHALGGRKTLTFDLVLQALESVLDEAEERARPTVTALERLAVARADVDDLNDQVDAMVRELADLVGPIDDDADREDQWNHLLGRVCASVPAPRCPVPGCEDLANPTPRYFVPSRGRHDGRKWPAALCRAHTVVRFEMFLQAVKAAELDDDGPIHAALVPVPELAYLAAPPGALRDPPRRSRLARVVDDE